MVCYTATVLYFSKFNHCCSMNVFTGELGSCRIGSAGAYIRNSQRMSLPLGMVKSLRSDILSVLSRSLSWYIKVAEVMISLMLPMYRAAWSARKGELDLHITIRQEHYVWALKEGCSLGKPWTFGTWLLGQEQPVLENKLALTQSLGSDL